MNILLVLPKIFANLEEVEHFPIGMAYVSSSLKKAGHNVHILNLNFENRPVKELLQEYISKYHIDIVETGGLITHYHMVKEVVDTVKEIDSKVYTLVGGGIITGAPEVVMQGIQNADFGVFGEGEITNCEVSRAIEGEIPFSKVDGLIYRKRICDKNDTSFECYKNQPRKEIEDLDSIPWPDYKGFSLDKMLERSPKKYVTMSTGRSCVFHCTFCFHTSGQKYRQRSLDGFFKELDYLVDEYGIDNIYITDELFACNQKRLDEFCERIKNYNILWAIQLRVNVANKKMLQQLKDSGCIIISYGLESADDSILASMKKGINIKQIEQALRDSYEVGISAHGAFIFGDINEDLNTVETTLQWWREHAEYNIGLAMIQVYPGTYLYQYAVENGIIKNELEFIEKECPYINVSKLTDQEYIKLGNELIKLQIKSNKYLVNEEIIAKDKNRLLVDVKGNCPNCGTEIIAKEIPMTKITVNKCSECSEKYSINHYHLFKKEIKDKLKVIQEQSNSIAFWGGGGIAHIAALYENVEYLSSMDFILVDPNNIVQGQQYCDRTILDPSELSKQHIDTVIVCDDAFLTYVSNVIKMKYRGVKRIIAIRDLLKE